MGGPVWVLLWSLRCHPCYGPEAWGLRSVVVTRASATRAGQSPQAVTVRKQSGPRWVEGFGVTADPGPVYPAPECADISALG